MRNTTRVGRLARPAPPPVEAETLTVAARRQRARAALVASGAVEPEIITTYDLARGTLAERKFYELAVASGRPEILTDRWPCEDANLAAVPGIVLQEDGAVVAASDGLVLYAEHSYGWMVVRVACEERARCAAVCSAFRSRFPASYLVEAEGQVPITFWTNTPHGPMPRLRRIDASGWQGIAGNYTAAVRAELERIMCWENGPGTKGQLLLWQGPPGTGKTWALRALASQWAPWAEFHYITDPDSFFVHDPSYMVNVLLADSYEALAPSGDVYSDTAPEGKWRILILEDTGELLAANAKDSYGQGLSRLLNVVDGMIGQGLRVLALVTTNDELGELHPAVKRPGRCASAVVFAPLTREEASSWLGRSTDGGTIAELYARRGDASEAFQDDDEGEAEPIAVKSIAPDAARKLATYWDANPEQRADEAEEHGADPVDDPLTFWTAEIAEDYHDGTAEIVRAAQGVLTLEAVQQWITEQEGEEAPELTAASGLDLTPPTEEELEAVYRDVLALARSPLPEATAADFARYQPRRTRGLQADVREVLDALTASGQTSRETITEALAAVARTHAESMETIRGLLAASASSGQATRGDALALAALGTLESFARRPDPPAPPAPDVHVHVPKQDLRVEVAAPETHVHVPEQAAQPAPVVNVTLPEQPAPQVTVAAAPAPEVKVEVQAPPAPDVHVTVEPPAPAPAPRSVRIETGEDGVRRFVAEE